MDKEKFLSSGLIDLYVLGLASEEDAEIVNQYAEAYPDIKSMITSLNVSLEQYARANSVDPPPALREKTFGELDQIIANNSIGSKKRDEEYSNNPNVPKAASESRSSVSNLGIGVGALLIIGLSFGMFHFNNKYDKSLLQVSELNNQLAECEENAAIIDNNNQIFAAQNEFLRNERTVHIQLNGTPNAPNAFAVAYWNEEEEYAYLNILDLPQPNADKQYQLWADVEGEMINMGILDYEKEKLIKIPRIAHAESLNVTLENLGGAEAPNVSQIFMSGKL